MKSNNFEIKIVIYVTVFIKSSSQLYKMKLNEKMSNTKVWQKLLCQNINFLFVLIQDQKKLIQKLMRTKD